MEFFVYIIPFITALTLFLFFRKRVVWWEYLSLIIPSLLFTLLVNVIMVECNSTDTEYLGGYVNKITYYEDWDELVRVRHESRDRVGTDKDGRPIYKTRVWYTTERRYHPKRWTYTSNDNRFETSIDERLYNKIKNVKGDGKNVFNKQDHLRHHGGFCCRGAEKILKNDDARMRRHQDLL